MSDEYKVRTRGLTLPMTFDSELQAQEWVRYEYNPEEWTILRRTVTDWEEIPLVEPCGFTFSHTRHWCGNPTCRES